MNGEEKDILIRFAGQIGELVAEVKGLKSNVENVLEKIDQYQEDCENFRRDCSAVKVLPAVIERVNKMETNQRVQALTRKQIFKIISAAVGIATGISALLKALGIL